jgi:hypothetical protein
MKAANNDRTKEGRNFENGSTENLISEILQLVQKQTEMLKKTTVSSEWAAEYKSRAWKIRELLKLLGKSD